MSLSIQPETPFVKAVSGQYISAKGPAERWGRVGPGSMGKHTSWCCGAQPHIQNKSNIYEKNELRSTLRHAGGERIGVKFIRKKDPSTQPSPRLRRTGTLRMNKLLAFFNHFLLFQSTFFF